MKYTHVPVPERCTYKRTEKATYVYLTLSVKYSKEKKRTIPSRVLIGKLDEEGLLIPNHNYIEMFGEEKELVPFPERADFVSIGLHMIVSEICKQLQLDELLEGVMEEDRAKMILWLPI